jgi:Sec-independent protein translocase protein TatA
MRSLGQGIVEFKRGVQGIEDDTHAASSRNADHADHAAGNG